MEDINDIDKSPYLNAILFYICKSIEINKLLNLIVFFTLTLSSK